MRIRLLFLLSGIVTLLASCQTTKATFQARPFGQVTSISADTATTVLLLHDSQGPQATRVLLTSAEAASFRQE